jgi:hypothetical protein
MKVSDQTIGSNQSYDGSHKNQKTLRLFIKGPIPFEWLRKANALGGSTGAVASGLWFYAGLSGSKRFKIDSRLDLLCGLTRQTRNHILQRLHYSQLIVLTPKHGAYPTVEILTLAKA